MRKVTITSYGDVTIQDISPVESTIPGALTSVHALGTQAAPVTVPRTSASSRSSAGPSSTAATRAR